MLRSMWKIALALLFSPLIAPTYGIGQVLTGTVNEHLSIESKILGASVSYAIYLPFDYAASTRSYPVVYLLHGAGGDETSWIRGGEAQFTADSLISTRAIPPLIIVMPRGESRYINNHDKSIRYEDFFFDEFIPHIESSYRVVANRQARAVMGFSMGGYGSLVYAFKHPDDFAASVSISASICEEDRVLSMSDDQWNVFRGPTYGMNLRGEGRLTDHYRAHDPCHMVQNADPNAFSSVKIFLDCGDDDFRNDGNATLHMLMRRLGIPHEYRVSNGAHNLTYARAGLEQGLKFVGTVFRNPSP